MSVIERAEQRLAEEERQHELGADAIEALQAELAGSKDAIRILKHNLKRKMEVQDDC